MPQNSPQQSPGHQALSHIDQVLGEKPRKNDHALSQATMQLAEFRDRLIAQRRQHGLSEHQQKQLGHVNAVITVVLGIHFPLGEIPWHELEKARGWLDEVVREDEPAV